MHDREEPCDGLLLATRSALLFEQLQQGLPLNQLHYQVEASIRLKGIIHLGKMLTFDSEEDSRLHQGLATRRWCNVVGFFDSTRPISLAGIDTMIDPAKTTSTDQRLDDIVSPNQCPRSQRL